MTRFGLGFWVFGETRDAVAYTTLLLFAVLPLGIGSLVAGPLVDRLSRTRVMVVANAVASMSTLAVALLYFAGGLELWHLAIALSVNGVANAFILPALESSVPLLVSKEGLGKAAGLTQIVQSLEVILAPALAGLVVGTLGLGAIFLVDFVTFGASILALLVSFVPRTKRRGEDAGFVAEFSFGVAYIRRRPGFLYLMGVLTLVVFLLPGVGYALVTPLVMTFSTEQAAGLVVSGFGIGSLLGGIVLSVWGGPKRRMHGILAAMLIAGLATTVVGFRESELLMAAGFSIVGACFVVIVGLNRVIWQTKADPDVLGRVFALRVALGVGAQSLGIFVAGPLAERVFGPLMAAGGALTGSVGRVIGVGPGRGMALIYLLVGVALVAVALASALTPGVRRLEDRIPDAEEGAAS
jgi:MFS family permease